MTKATAEEEYFLKINQELIQNKRVELDQKKESQKKESIKEAHWMRCPKCGDALKEIEMKAIKVDRCNGCSGIFFDNGELDILLDSQKPENFMDFIKNKISN